MDTFLLVLFAVFIGISLLHLVYLLSFIVACRRIDTEAKPTAVGVSVIVSAHDEEENLRTLVPLLLAQDYNGPFEVIIVNDRSNDGTYDFLLDATRDDERLKMVNVKDTPSHVNGKKFALTLGIRAAAHEWVLLTDADCRPGHSWISSMSRRYDDQSQFVLGVSPYMEEAGFLNQLIRYESLLTALQYCSFALLGNPYMGVGRNLSYRKSLFLEKKGFNNFLSITGGDDDLFVNQHASAKNVRVEVSAESVVMSMPEKTWKNFFDQKIRHLSVGKKYRKGHIFLLGMFNLSWFLSIVLSILLVVTSQATVVVVSVAVGWVMRWILQALALNSLARRAGLKYNFWILPVLDIVYPIYYISTGLVALFTKKVRWKS